MDTPNGTEDGQKFFGETWHPDGELDSVPPETMEYDRPELAPPDEVVHAYEPGAEGGDTVPEVHFDTPLAYDAYMGFSSPESRPWEADTITRHLTNLGAEDPTVTQAEANGIQECYAGTHRFYHGPDHGAFVGQPAIPEPIAPLPADEPYDPGAGRLSNRVTREWAESTNAVAGLWHDAAYKHVDGDDQGNGAWSEAVDNLIGDVARYERTEADDRAVYRTYVTQAGAADPVTQTVAHVFGVGEDGIAHNQGGNEFDSALAAAKFLEAKGADSKTIVTAVAGIAATVPFKPALVENEAGQLTDGHMGALANLVKTAQLHGYQPDWQDVNDIMHLSVALANRDVAPFVQPDNLGAVIHNGRGVKMEEVGVLRKQVGTMSELVEAASRTASAPLLYEWLGTGSGPVPAANVPHVYMPRDTDGNILDGRAAFPPLPVHQEAVRHAEINSRLASTFFKAHEAGITFAAAVATSVGEPNAPVPGFVHARLWPYDKVPQGPQLNPEETRLFNELMYGVSQSSLDSATPARSPIGGALGTQGMQALSARIQEIRDQARAEGMPHPFSDPDIARGFAGEVVARIGQTNAAAILSELERTAEFFAGDPLRGSTDRAFRIRRLSDSLGLAA